MGNAAIKQSLEAQNAETSSFIISHLETNDLFLKLSEYEGNQILKRDEEDETKLRAGIQIGIDRGTLPADHNSDSYKIIDVLGKTPKQVVDIILDDVGKNSEIGCLIVLCGLSGTGKGTTADMLKNTLPNCVAWSNGNIFRSVTLLAATWCEQNNFEESDINKALTDENIKSFMNMLRFEKLESTGWDVVIEGLGLNTSVNEIQNTLLKSSKVSKNIPTVAQQTQGEVINFARDALDKMAKDGKNILLEGREQTVNYIPSPYRYTLVLSDPTLVGKRRAAQRLAALTLVSVKSKNLFSEDLSEDAIHSILLEQLCVLSKEIPV